MDPTSRNWFHVLEEHGMKPLEQLTRAATLGHFAAWEQPELFASALRAAFRSLRSAR